MQGGGDEYGVEDNRVCEKVVVEADCWHAEERDCGNVAKAYSK